MNAEEDFAAINYYCRRKLYHHVHDFCTQRLKRRVGDPLLIFWKAASLIWQAGRASEAIRGLEPLQDKKDLTLPTTIALIAAHERCKYIDQEAIQELEAKLAISSESATPSAQSLILTGMFHLHIGNLAEARRNIKKAIADNQAPSEALSLMGWIEADPSGLAPVSGKARSWFDRVLEKQPNNSDATLGRIHFLRKRQRDLPTAVDLISTLVVQHAHFVPAFIERMYLLVESEEWDQVLDASNRVISLAPDSFDARIVLLVHYLAREGDLEAGAAHLRDLAEVLGKVEPTNAPLYHQIALFLRRLSNRTPSILQVSMDLLQHAISLDPGNAEYVAETGFVYFQTDDFPRAKEALQAALALDPQNWSAFLGQTFTQAATGDLDTAEEQLQMVEEFQLGEADPGRVALVHSMVAWHKYKNAAERIKWLTKAAEAHLTLDLEGASTLEYYTRVAPELVLVTASQLAVHCPSTPKREGEEAPEVVKRMLEMLEILCRIVPGNTDALYYKAKAQYLSADQAQALSTTTRCLKINPMHTEAYLLLAQIHLALNHDQQAMQALETGLSYDFKVREVPLFHGLKARALKMQGRYEEALETLKAAMELGEMREGVEESRKISSIRTRTHPTTTHERMTIYLELADAHTKLHQPLLATRVMQTATRLFSHPDHRDRLTLANAEFALARSDPDAALAVLATIHPDTPSYIAAKKLMAEIYLTHKRDKKGYARCYSELVERNPTVESCLLLGDAYMNLQEPEKAIAIYESAMDASPEAGILAAKVGKALVRTHNYQRAISYYQSGLATDSPHNTTFRYDLAELYFKLQRHENADTLLEEAIAIAESEESRDNEYIVRTLLLLAKVRTAKQQFESALATLEKARDLQIHLASKESVVAENRNQQAILSQINVEIADLLANVLKDTERAIVHYNEAVEQNPGDEKATISLCRLHLTTATLLPAQQHCANLLRLNPSSEPATILMADIMALKNSYNESIAYFRQLLEKSPANYAALARLIETMRRNGTLSEVDGFLKSAEGSSVKVHLHPGYHFCKGLHFRYTNATNEALKEFNFCRKDAEWGERALYHMIEIFLNPDNETIGGEALDAATDAAAAGSSAKGSEEVLAVLTADKLLKELPQNPKSLRTQILEGNAMLATKQKADIERAVTHFTEILTVEKDYVPALLGLATAHMLLKQSPRARNHLKRISKMDWSPQFASEFEQTWLLLADINIQAQKYEPATTYLTLLLTHNKSSARALEYLGLIHERQSQFTDAARVYNDAWTLDGKINPALGYKLAFNLMKVKKFVEAVDVCHRVLGMYPEYPKMRGEVLGRARAMLRCP
ncbi:uncharacterized protein EV422DRAFT_517791 [Fimicolochytrium jonesii]|uniref:uncharacterized protein n=1 Tax=Fimicolochytrium jonesii TaxID=1396493 RepID=UPI0022FF0576|nr:uncharacterized protein EV422DRAFT_517791 [Fimicolochytrium jonesii]KAI8825186.1 hypothetical protein EV422DRAFT_517791 [Fimicolochytrium jonesii]